jgi:hypothetical protein
MNSAWKEMCIPAKVFPMFMASLILFDVYLGNMRNMALHLVSFIVGTALLYTLCHFNMETVAWVILMIPILFFLSLLALIILDLSLIKVTHTFQQRCHA